MAVMCREYLKRYPTAVQLYRQAFKAQPALAEDLNRQHRYNAVCAAAVGGAVVAPPSGSDAKEAPKGGTGEEKAALRRQARDWLLADLDVYSQKLDHLKPEANRFVEQRLAYWQTDPPLHGVRDAKALAALPEAERDEWRKLWSAVDQLLKQARKAPR
jgi:hypothetical protein